MLKKIRIGRMLLLIVVVVIANLYFGCLEKYYPPDSSQYQTKQDAQIKDQDAKIKAMQKEMEELKKQK
jgi:cell division protein FtsL